jgi:hypothetical protein
LISGSAVGFYGDRGDEVLTEESSAGEGFLSGVVKAWEAEAHLVEDLGVRLVQLRTGVVLGVSALCCDGSGKPRNFLQKDRSLRLRLGSVCLSVGAVFGTLRGAGLMEKLPKLPGPRRQATRWTVTDAGRKAISQQAR